ncbi:hypothetical protein D187_000599 [Cystobacter fuscus DSM 2262]|uniref:Uncharacterized protein n=1 Tax=Cystobacter fuscus (strain ATCC 25194 / DSM 2262 / NBRC 100088 / M29) TaxID=1242864 RepID=S9QV22_CYSF2|nr:hypothetical protein D187_000599 [Cystobacter fuscus DSM 2262]
MQAIIVAGERLTRRMAVATTVLPAPNAKINMALLRLLALSASHASMDSL